MLTGIAPDVVEGKCTHGSLNTHQGIQRTLRSFRRNKEGLSIILKSFFFLMLWFWQVKRGYSRYRAPMCLFTFQCKRCGTRPNTSQGPGTHSKSTMGLQEPIVSGHALARSWSRERRWGPDWHTWEPEITGWVLAWCQTLPSAARS